MSQVRVHGPVGAVPTGRHLASDRWILPGRAMRALELLVRFVVANHELVFAVPGQAAAELQEGYRQEAHAGRSVADPDVADRTLAGLDAAEEVGEQLADVLIVGLVLDRSLMDRRFLAVDGVEGPAVSPACVEVALDPIKIAADVVFLSRVSGVEPVLSDGGERVEGEAGDPGVGGVGDVSPGRPISDRKVCFKIC